MYYELKVYCAAEGIVALRLRTLTRELARREAEQKGYRVISIRPRWYGGGATGGAKRFSQVLFSEELLTLLEAGLSLVEIIELLARKTKQKDVGEVLSTLARYLHEGQSFSRALELLPESFSPLFVATVRTSEQTGDLTESLRRYLAYQQQLNAVRTKIVSASVYPALLIGVGFLVILFLLGYVVPRFSHIYEDLGGNLPWTSKLLMHWGQLVSLHAGSLALASILLIGGLAFALTRPATRAWIERRLWDVPALGEQIRLYQLARFTRTLAMLINGGIPFVTAFDMVGGLLRQPALQQGLSLAGQAVREGRAVSDAFAAYGLATEVGVRLIVVGERSGEMGRALERIAKLYDDEVARWVEWFTRLFEPVLMLAIGIVIGLIVVLMYLPIFELANSLQ